ncbi:MAG: hypothetical protein QXL73_06155 [Thermoplasmata archaeon]
MEIYINSKKVKDALTEGVLKDILSLEKQQIIQMVKSYKDVIIDYSFLEDFDDTSIIARNTAIHLSVIT